MQSRRLGTAAAASNLSSEADLCTPSLANATNQPSFGSNTAICDNFIEYFNTSISRGANAPVPIQAKITVQPPFFPIAQTFTNAYGIRVDRAFLENNFIPCEQLKGYSGPGEAAYS